MTCPDFSLPFVLQTDASDIGLGAVLFQRHGGSERVISYASRKLTDREQKYSTTEKECLAIIWAIQKHEHYLEGYEFTVVTDHMSLKWLLKLENPKGRLARWLMLIQQFKFSVEYRTGSQNIVPDALSRYPVSEENGPELEFNNLVEEPESATHQRCKWYFKKFDEVQRYPEKFPDFTIANGKLFHHSSASNFEDESWKLCLPEPQRTRALHENHASPTAGHLGRRKTINRVCQSYYWPGMCRDIRRFVDRCTTCLEYKVPQQKPAGYMHTIHPSKPWEVVCIDFVGPLPRSVKGFRYFFIAQDKLTKWCEIKGMNTPTTTGAKNMLRSQVFSKFGWPKVVISNNGSQFTSKNFKDFLSENFVYHQYTPKYSPQCNPVERTNRVINTMIASFTKNKSHRKWDEFLPELQFAYNTSMHETTGFTPAQLNFGRELLSPGTLLSETRVDTEANESPEEKSSKIEEMIEMAKLNIKKAAENQRKYYNLRRRNWFPAIGEEVYIKTHHLSSAPDAFAAKLAPKYEGPYVVADFPSPTVVIVVDPKNSKAKSIIVHLKDVKPLPNHE